MRIKELLVEREMPERKSRVMSYAKVYPGMPSSNPYAIYRFGMAMADHTINHAEGPASNSAVIMAYTDEEEEIIRGGESQTGHKGQQLADRGSLEPRSTDTRSPVAQAKRNKYGV